MNEVKPEATTPPLFYCKPVNDKGGPCHAPDCNHRSSCMLQMKRQQHSKDGKTSTHRIISGVPSPVAIVANVVTTKTNVT